MELLARAALAGISPTLLADRGNWRNVYHALGHPPTAKRFAPVSIRVTEVLNILHELRAEFTKELLDSCIEECGYGNAELHSGEEAISGTGTSSWLPQYYASCQAFLGSLGKSLEDLFSDTKQAEEMIASLKDTAAKSVEKDIHDHKEKWGKTEPKQQAVLSGQAATWASRHAGHRTVCLLAPIRHYCEGRRKGASVPTSGRT